MRRSEVIKFIIKESAEYADGETDVRRCIEMACEALAKAAYDEEFKRGALEAGIPLSVIEGRSKLSDHFSEEYIKSQCPRGEK